MRRLTLLVAALVASVALLSQGVARADGWCFIDPIVTINGQTVQILTGVNVPPSQAASTVKFVDTEIHVPVGVATRLISLDTSPFGDRKVSFVQDSSLEWKPGTPMPVTVIVHVKSQQPLAIQTIINYPGGTLTTTGTTSTGTTSSFTLP